jgi:hypothetical protein
MRAAAAVFEKLFTPLSVAELEVIGWPWCGSCRNCLEGQPRYCLDLGPLVLRGGRADGTTSLRRMPE